MLELASNNDPGTRATVMLTSDKFGGGIISMSQSTVTSPLFVIDLILAVGRSFSSTFLKCELHPSEN